MLPLFIKCIFVFGASLFDLYYTIGSNTVSITETKKEQKDTHFNVITTQKTKYSINVGSIVKIIMGWVLFYYTEVSGFNVNNILAYLLSAYITQLAIFRSSFSKSETEKDIDGNITIDRVITTVVVEYYLQWKIIRILIGFWIIWWLLFFNSYVLYTTITLYTFLSIFIGSNNL